MGISLGAYVDILFSLKGGSKAYWLKLIAFVVLACLATLGCAADPEEDWTHAEAYFECFFDAYESQLDGLAFRNDSHIEALTYARTQCHVPPRGAVRSVEQIYSTCNNYGWSSQRCQSKNPSEINKCHSQAESIIQSTYGEFESTAMLTSHVCYPDYRSSPQLDGSEAD